MQRISWTKCEFMERNMSNFIYFTSARLLPYILRFFLRPLNLKKTLHITIFSFNWSTTSMQIADFFGGNLWPTFDIMTAEAAMVWWAFQVTNKEDRKYYSFRCIFAKIRQNLQHFYRDAMHFKFYGWSPSFGMLESWVWIGGRNGWKRRGEKNKRQSFNQSSLIYAGP